MLGVDSFSCNVCWYIFHCTHVLWPNQQGRRSQFHLLTSLSCRWSWSISIGARWFFSCMRWSNHFFFNGWSKDSLPFYVPFFIFTFNCKASFLVGIHYFSIMTTKLSVQLQWSWSDSWKNFEQHAENILGTPQGQITKTWTLLNPCNQLMLLTHSWQATLHDSYSKA